MGWLGGWDKRVKITIDQDDIDAVLSNFPHLVYLSASSGHSSRDVSYVFDELLSDINRKKIAVTRADGITQCYVEIEKWDHTNEKAWLWVKVPSVTSDVDTELYLYYDNDHIDNTDYVGDPSDAVVHNVWDDDFEFVTHMGDDPDTSHIGDSTANANNGSKKGANEPAVAAGKIGDAQHFDGENDYVSLDAHVANFVTLTQGTLECWFNNDAWTSGANIYISAGDKTDAASDLYLFTTVGDHYYQSREAGVGLLYMNAGIGAPDTGNWHYFVMCVDIATDGKLYLDGVDVTNITAGSDEFFADINDIDFLRIGNRVDSDVESYHTDGLIDEVRISTVKRSAAWIKVSYESERDHLNDFGSEESLAVGFPYTFPFLFDEYTPIFVEIITLADIIIKYFQFGPQTFAENIVLTDAMVPIMGKIFIESIDLADTIWAKIMKELIEDVDLTDSLTKYVVMAALIENPQLGDTITLKALKEFVETTVLADVILKKIITEFVEQTNLQDIITKIVQKILADNVTLTDLALDLKTMKNLAEQIDLLDSIIKSTILHEFGEGIVLADLTLDFKTMKNLGEQIDLLDSIIKGTILGDFDEGVVLSEEFLKTIYTTLGEQIDLLDFITKGTTLHEFDEGIILSDEILKEIYTALEEQIDLLDSVLKSTILHEFGEGIILSDEIFPVLAKILIETILLSEVLTKLTGKSITEQITLTEFMNVRRIVEIGLSLLKKVHTLGRTDLDFVIELVEKNGELNQIEKEILIDLFRKMKTLELTVKDEVIGELTRAISSQRVTKDTRVIVYDKDKDIEDIEKDEEIELTEKDRTVRLVLGRREKR